MTIGEFLQWIIEHKEYAPLYSALVATGAFIFSVISFIISNVNSRSRAKKDKAISDARYEEQKKQYEERLSEERKQREEDKKQMEEKNRISEEPYLVFKKSEIKSPSTSKNIIIRMEFLNKGRGSAYEITPDSECEIESLDKKLKKLRRIDVIEDPIARVGETYEIVWGYFSAETVSFKVTPTIRYRDASGRRYKQTYCINIIDDYGNASIINYANPELIEE